MLLDLDPPSQDFTICYTAIAGFLGDANIACILQRIHYWLQNENSGYLLGDATKWIYNGYKEWQQQFPWLSPQQIGRHLRRLEQLGWVISSRFHKLVKDVGFVTPAPHMQEDNQRKWYRLNYQKIFEDTGFDLLFASGSKQSNPSQRLKRSPRANVQNCTLQSSDLNDAMFKNEQSSIYKEDQKKPNLSLEEKEKENLREDRESEISHPNLEVKGIEELIEEKEEEKYRDSKNSNQLAQVRYSAATTLQTEVQDNSKVWADGPWMEQGKLRSDFLTWRANRMMTGPKPICNSITDARITTMRMWRKDPAGLAIDWQAYHEESVHRLATAVVTERSGGHLAEEEDLHQLEKLKPAVVQPGNLPLEYEVRSQVREYAPDLADSVESAVREGQVEMSKLMPQEQPTVNTESVRSESALLGSPSGVVVSDGNMSVFYRDCTGIAASQPKIQPPSREELLARKRIIWEKAPAMRSSIRAWALENSDWVELTDDGLIEKQRSPL